MNAQSGSFLKDKAIHRERELVDDFVTASWRRHQYAESIKEQHKVAAARARAGMVARNLDEANSVREDWQVFQEMRAFNESTYLAQAAANRMAAEGLRQGVRTSRDGLAMERLQQADWQRESSRLNNEIRRTVEAGTLGRKKAIHDTVTLGKQAPLIGYVRSNSFPTRRR